MKEFARSAKQLADAGFLSASAAKRVFGALNALRGLAVRDRDGIMLGQTDQEICREARAALAEAAEAVCGARVKKDGVALAALRRDAASIKRALLLGAKGIKSQPAILRFSPVREFPQLVYGNRSVERELNFLWSRCSSVACVSATLYLRRTDKFSAGYMISILSIPPERLNEYDPIRPSWALKPVQGLWLPEPIPGWLRPPSRRDKLSEAELKRGNDRWHGEVAHELLRIRESAKGGVLALMTSYQSIHQVALAMGDKAHDLVQSNPRTTLMAQRALFMKMSAEGRKPLWLALGGAWTGLDINGKALDIPAAEDNLLTDLAIVRLPFSINTSLTHDYRCESQPAVPWDLLDATMRTIQGVGRLVRREGLPENRRIFLLDGRVNDGSFANYLTPIRIALSIYPQKVWQKDSDAK